MEQKILVTNTINQLTNGQKKYTNKLDTNNRLNNYNPIGKIINNPSSNIDNLNLNLNLKKDIKLTNRELQNEHLNKLTPLARSLSLPKNKQQAGGARTLNNIGHNSYTQNNLNTNYKKININK